MNTLGAIVQMTIRGLLSGKRIAAPLLLGLIPVALVAVVIYVRQHLGLSTLPPAALYHLLVPGYFHTFLIFAALLFGTSAVSEDEEDGSVVYLLLRPIRRGLVYLGKVTAASILTAIALLVSVTLTFAVLRLAGGSESGPDLALLPRDLGWLALGSLAYPAAFAAVGVMSRRPLLLAAGYLLLWEIPFSFAPTALRYLTVSHYLLSLMPHTSAWNAAVSTLQMVTPPGAATAGLLALVIALIALGSIRYEQKEHLPAASV